MYFQIDQFLDDETNRILYLCHKHWIFIKYLDSLKKSDKKWIERTFLRFVDVSWSEGFALADEANQAPLVCLFTALSCVLVFWSLIMVKKQWFEIDAQ
jgi:lipoprotein signal peptidase